MINAALRCTVIALGFAVIAAASQAGDKLHVGKASATAFAMMPLVVGAAEGIYARHGIDVDIVDFEGGSKLAQATAAGSIDIGIGSGAELALVAKGAPELGIACPAGLPLFIGIAVPDDSPAKTADDLKGKRIGISSINSMTYWMALELARKHGWGDTGITPIAIGSSSTAVVAAFRTHQVDADIGGTALAFQLEEKKQGRLLIPVSDYLGNMCSDAIFASTQLIKTNPDAIRRFLVAWFESTDYMRHNKAETVRIIRGVTGFDETVQGREYDQSIPMFNDDGKFDAQSLATLERSFSDLKLLDFKPDMSTLYTEAFLPKR